MIRLTAPTCAILCTLLSSAASAEGVEYLPDEATRELMLKDIHGGWSASCRDVRLTYSDLVATCADQNGDWHKSRPSFARLKYCGKYWSPIENINGQLTCVWKEVPEYDTTGSFGYGVPLLRQEEEDYLPSSAVDCSKVYIDGMVLTGWCLTNHEMDEGDWVSIDLSTCGSPKAVLTNGQLTCLEPAAAVAPGELQYMTKEQMQEIPGGWSSACRNAYDNGTELIAECSDSGDNWVWASVNPRSCTPPIEYENGRLICAAPTVAPAQTQDSQSKYLSAAQMREIPGTWSDSCENAGLDGNVLSAECLNADGAWPRSTLDLQACEGNPLVVMNEGGQLVCP